MAVFIPPTGDAVIMLGFMKSTSLGKQNTTLWDESWLVSIILLPCSKQHAQRDLLLDWPDGHGCPRPGLNREARQDQGSL